MYDAHLTLIVSDFDSNQTCEPELANFCLFTVVLHPCDPHSSSSLLNRSGAHLNLSSCLILLHIKGFGFPLWVFSALGSRDDRLVTCHCHSFLIHLALVAPWSFCVQSPCCCLPPQWRGGQEDQGCPSALSQEYRPGHKIKDIWLGHKTNFIRTQIKKKINTTLDQQKT